MKLSSSWLLLVTWLVLMAVSAVTGETVEGAQCGAKVSWCMVSSLSSIAACMLSFWARKREVLKLKVRHGILKHSFCFFFLRSTSALSCILVAPKSGMWKLCCLRSNHHYVRWCFLHDRRRKCGCLSWHVHYWGS
jgi:hypothetical protein